MQNWPTGTQKFVFDTIDSTMAEARRQAPVTAGAAWFLAHQQTAGTGRRGRAWDSQKGNFAASLLIRPDATPEKLALRSFVAALALFDTLIALTGRDGLFSLKWPNDVLLRGGKLAGILLETIAEGPDRFGLIVGIGVNLRSKPASSVLEHGAIDPRTLSEATGLKITPEQFLDTLAPSFAAWETRLQNFGFQPLQQAWLSRAANIGKPIIARLPNQTVTGTFKTVDETGALIIQGLEQQHVITAADISF